MAVSGAQLTQFGPSLSSVAKKQTFVAKAADGGPTGRVMGALAGKGGLAGMGGLAGKHGGIAG